MSVCVCVPKSILSGVRTDTTFIGTDFMRGLWFGAPKQEHVVKEWGASASGLQAHTWQLRLVCVGDLQAWRHPSLLPAGLTVQTPAVGPPARAKAWDVVLHSTILQKWPALL